MPMIDTSGRRAFLAGSVAACALSHAAPARAAEPAAPIQSFVLANWKVGGTSPGFARQGVIFKKGDLPAGSSLQVRRKGAPIAAQFDERVTWSDGSLKFAVMHLRDAPFAASESRTYELWAQPGAFDNTATHTLLDITSRHRFLIQFTSLTEAMDDKSTRKVGSGNFFADFAAHMAHPTRVEAHHAGSVCDGWTGWGMAVDGVGEAPDAHLKTNWHADIWKNADGSIHAVEIGAVVAQDWWSVPDKRMRRYDAMLRDSNTGLALYRSVEHPYKSQWITCQSTTDNNRGRRHWIGGACPSLNYIPSRATWVASGLVPPLNLASKPAAYAAINRGGAAYSPCGSQSHRGNIDGTGGYEGRGVLTNPDCIAFLRQTADDVAAARINAHAGLHVFLHYRSDRTRIRPGDVSPDIANTPISMIMGISRGTVPGYDFTADGMPIPVHAYADGRTTPAGRDNYAGPGDNGGVWSITTGDASHAVNYSYFMYLMEGERYHLEASLDLATNLVHQGIDNIYSNRPQNPVARDGLGRATHAPDTVYDAIAGLNSQERSAGWALVVLGSAAGIVPDRHVAARFIKRLNQQQAIYLRDILATLPDDAKAAGVSPFTDALGLSSPWMGAFNVMGGYHNWHVTETPEARAWAEFTANVSIGMVESHLYKTMAYRLESKQRTAPYDAVTNRYLPRAQCRIISAENDTRYSAQVNQATNVLTFKPTVKLTNGDVVYVSALDDNGNPIGTPADLAQGVPYYLVQVAGDTARLATTPGGTAVACNAATGIGFSCDPHGAYDPLTTPAPTSLTADDYAPIHRAALVMAQRAGHPDVSPMIIKKIQAFTARIDNTKWATWDMMN